jgi:two-component system sensor histidine kinase AlgZ
MIPLAEELSLGRRFLDMEQRRLGNRLEIEWDVDALPGDAMVMPLILQPLLENAVLHGIQPREEGGLVKVYGRAEPDAIVIMISNPVSLSTDDAQQKMEGNGMALNNIRRRLGLAFGDQASLVTSQGDQQFFSVLTLPLEFVE